MNTPLFLPYCISFFESDVSHLFQAPDAILGSFVGSLDLFEHTRKVPLMKTNWTVLLAATVAAALLLDPTTAIAVVVHQDGFGDADRNNNGIPLEAMDVRVCSAIIGMDCKPGNTTASPVNEYTPGRLSNTNLTPNPQVTSVLDSNDVGLRWASNAGFTNSNAGDEKAYLAILDDTQGNQLETKPTSVVGGLGATAINDGYALSVNSRGRGTSAVAFFDGDYTNGNQGRISLGTLVGDQVKVSFDFRVWADASHANGSLDRPWDAELRFGLFQDTDNQLGMSNPVAGRDQGIGGPKTAAVWGQDDGWFEGAQYNASVANSEIGTPGDHGWYGQVVVEDPNGTFPPTGNRVNGGGWRIREETNVGSTTDIRLMQGTGDDDTVAVPQPMTPGGTDFGLVNLKVDKVYNLSLTLERFTDVNPGDTIKAYLTATDRATGISYTLSNYEKLMISDGMGGMIPDGISSDSWDYFAIRATGFDDLDYLIDNFKVETFSSTPSADFDADGDVDGRDFLVWQRGAAPGGATPANLALWQSQYGTPSTAVLGAVPEPSSLLLLSLGSVLSLSMRRRNRR